MKPGGREEDYFVRQEYERLQKLYAQKNQAIAAGEKERLQKMHYMRCPKCGMELVEINYRMIKIDRCTECRGVWLDAGELEAVSELEKSGLDRLFSIFR